MLDLIAGGKNDHRRFIAAFAQFAQHINAIAMRQPEVEQHHIEGRCLQCGGSAEAVAHPIDREPRLAKRRLQALRDHAIVLDEQYSHVEAFSE